MSSGICSNGRCENFMGGYECVCDLGYKPNPLKTACTGMYRRLVHYIQLYANQTCLCVCVCVSMCVCACVCAILYYERKTRELCLPCALE